MKIHRNLLVIKAETTLWEELLADSKIAAMAVARVAPDLFVIQRRDHNRLVERMKKLGHGHKEIGKW